MKVSEINNIVHEKDKKTALINKQLYLLCFEAGYIACMCEKSYEESKSNFLNMVEKW